jgi:hypothetical protein
MKKLALIAAALWLAAIMAEVAQAQIRNCTSQRVGNTVYTTCY